MPTAHKGPWPLSCALIFGLVLTGCNQAGSLEKTLSSAKVSSQKQISASSQTETRTVSKAYAPEDQPKRLSVLSNALRKTQSERMSVADIKAERSPRCRRLLAHAGIQASILRSPTISTEYSDDKDLTTSAGYDFLDLRRADIIEEIGVAQCERQDLVTKLTYLLTSSNQSLSRSGYIAVANALAKARQEFDQIDKTISEGLENGEVTLQTANSLKQYLSQIRFQEAQARGNAAGRQFVDELHSGDFGDIDKQLLAVERRIHSLRERKRTLDALQVSANANFDVKGGTLSAAEERTDVSGTLKLSVRLGAFSQRRQELERISEQATLDAYYEEGSGPFWQTRELRRALLSSITSLRQQLADIDRALEDARSNSGLREFSQDPEVFRPTVRGRIDIILLSARRAGIVATLRDIHRLSRSLAFQ